MEYVTVRLRAQNLGEMSEDLWFAAFAFEAFYGVKGCGEWSALDPLFVVYDDIIQDAPDSIAGDDELLERWLVPRLMFCDAGFFLKQVLKFQSRVEALLRSGGHRLTATAWRWSRVQLEMDAATALDELATVVRGAEQAARHDVGLHLAVL